MSALSLIDAYSGCDYAALVEASRVLAPGRLAVPPEMLPQHAWCGQVFARRAVHRSLLFISLCTDGSAGSHARVELLLREDVIGREAMRDLASVGARLGDILRVHGALENSGGPGTRPLLVATHVRRVAEWPQAPAPPFDRFASPPAPPLLGLPADYATRIAGHIARCDPDVPAAAAPPAAPAPPPLLASRAEAVFDGVPLHRLCRWFVAADCQGGACHTVGCDVLHELPPPPPDSSVPESRRVRAVTAAWERWRSRVRALGLPVQDGDEGAAARAAHRAGHSRRAAVFASWLVAAAPTLLRRGGGTILDVAGGRGDVATALAQAGAEVVTVDPRPSRPRKLHQCREAGASVHNADASNGSGDGGEDDGTGECSVTAVVAPRAAPPRHIQALFGRDFEAAHADLLSRVALVFGFHPDEATEPIVDWAIRARVPLAVVPCCVFGRLFPHRRRADGGEVTSFDDFVGYLRGMLRAAGRPPQTSFLEYNGANLVLHEGLR